MIDEDARAEVSVVVPTYRRPESLRRCLISLIGQSHPPLEVLVAYRANDVQSAEVVRDLARCSTPLVRPIVVGEDANLETSMNAAVAETRGEFVALTDDDAEAPPSWIERLVAAFDDDAIAGVGGRDWQPHERWDEPIVGVVRWWGKLIGNHHLGAGARRDVDVLKGVNCCFRGQLLRAIGIDPRLRGVGNVSHWELHVCLTLRRGGWRIVYDPDIAIDHHIEQRMDGDDNARGGFRRQPFIDAVHNGHLALLEHLPTHRRVVYRWWSLLVGTSATPGLAQLVRLLCQGKPPKLAVARFFASRVGAAEAGRTWAEGKRPGVPKANPKLTTAA